MSALFLALILTKGLVTFNETPSECSTYWWENCHGTKAQCTRLAAQACKKAPSRGDIVVMKATPTRKRKVP